MMLFPAWHCRHAIDESESVSHGQQVIYISKMPMALCGYMGEPNFLIVLITVIVLIAIIATYSIKSKL
jgi:hypothetical protein